MLFSKSVSGESRSIRKVKLTLSSIPLHAVLRGQLTEVSLDDGRVLRVLGQGVLVTNGTKILLAVGLEFGINAHRGLSGVDVDRAGNRLTGEKERQRSSLELNHFE